MDIQVQIRVVADLLDQAMVVVDQAQMGTAMVADHLTPMVVDHLTPILLEAHTPLEEARGVQCMQ